MSLMLDKVLQINMAQLEDEKAQGHQAEETVELLEQKDVPETHSEDVREAISSNEESQISHTTEQCELLQPF